MEVECIGRLLCMDQSHQTVRKCNHEEFSAHPPGPSGKCWSLLIELLCEPYRIDSIAGWTDIQTGPQPRPGILLATSTWPTCTTTSSVHDVTDSNLRDTDVSTVTERERMWRDPKRCDLSESSLFIGQSRNKKRFPSANQFSVLNKHCCGVILTAPKDLSV